MNAARILLESAIDYAGLFPPAGLGMDPAVRKYADYRRGKQRWALGRFVVPVARLDEFNKVPVADLDPADPWLLSVLGGTDLAADLRAIAAFRRPGVRIASLEIKAASPVEVERAALSIRGSINTFYEMPIAQNPIEILDAVREAKGFAKVRTGGTKPGMVPPSKDLARFLHLAATRVPFKATAGLHHAVRSLRPLTYDTPCESDTMHGFLNVFVAAALAHDGAEPELLARVLEEKEPRSFVFGSDAVRWKDRDVRGNTLRDAREATALSFGSCSFEEPITELKGLGLL